MKYAWGQTVDAKVNEARANLLRLCGKNDKDYCVAFTLNTTYGINLVLHQLASGSYARIVTSDIEHNSVMLPTMTWAKRHGVPRTVLAREDDGGVRYATSDLEHGLVIVNAASNIDGREARNLKRLADDTHAAKGALFIDAAQGFAHGSELVRGVDFDALFGSGHKMYGPSIGFVVLKRSLLQKLDPFFIGGGTVTDVDARTYSLLRDGPEAHAVLEAGLQNWGGIVGLLKAIEWLEGQKEAKDRERVLAQKLFAELQTYPRVRLFNKGPAPIVSFHIDGIDAHALALYLSEQNVMCRSGYFCCHSYLLHQMKSPPLLRVSLGLYNTEAHIDMFLAALSKILTAF